MPSPNDPAAFRAQMTLIYQVICVVLALVVVAAGAVGWWKKRGVGLAVGLGLGLVAAGAIWFAVSLIWAMTQDGA